MDSTREYYKYIDINKGIFHLLFISKGFIFPHYLSVVKPPKYSKRYRGLYRCNLSMSVNEFNEICREHATRLTQEEFNKEVDDFKVKAEMLQELVN